MDAETGRERSLLEQVGGRKHEPEISENTVLSLCVPPALL